MSSLTGIGSRVDRALSRKAWGEKSLSFGEIAGLAVGVVGLYFGLKKKKRLYIYASFAAMAIMVALF